MERAAAQWASMPRLADLAPSGHCLTCDGQRQVRGQQCQSCQGTGVMVQKAGGQSCHLCEGSGEYTRYQVSPDGRERTPVRTERCMTCNGTGRVPREPANPLPPGWIGIHMPESA